MVYHQFMKTGIPLPGFRSWVAGLLLSAAGGAAIVPAGAAVVGKEVTYQTGGTTLKGYLAYDAAKAGPRPGVLVIHEWWGHNAYARKRAEMLAELGYAALAVDMFGDGKTADHPKDAGAFAGAVMGDIEVGEARFQAAMEFLKSQPQTDRERIAAIGYCFGGAIALHMARIGMPLDAVASFHGNLSPKKEAQEGRVKARILVCNGADDSFIPKEQIEAFHREMSDANVDYRFENYPGAKHGFTNPEATALGRKFDLELAYQEEADRKSWAALKKLLREVFGE